MNKAEDRKPLESQYLRWECPPEWLNFESTENLAPTAGIVGQTDAIEALRFGLEISAEGQNIFVRGLNGTGRMTLIKHLLDQMETPARQLLDYCYVQNFKHADRPSLITLEKGKGRQFKQKIDLLIEFIDDQLGPALSSENVRAKRSEIDKTAHTQMRDVGEPFEVELTENELVLVPVQVGRIVQPTIMVLLNGEPVPLPQMEAEPEKYGLSNEQISEYRAKIEDFSARIEDVSHKIIELQMQHRQKIRNLYETEARVLLSPLIQGILVPFATQAVSVFLNDLVEDLIEHYLPALGQNPNYTEKYRVNLLMDRSQTEGRPIIVEQSPSLTNLLGNIDREFVPGGAFRSDHTMIQPGSIIQADGGFLIIQARDVLSERGSWEVLMRTLRTGYLEIVPSEMQSLSWFGPLLKPEAVPIDIKVVLVGDPGLYSLLDTVDPDFPKLFKVLSDFNETIPLDRDSVNHYAGVIARIVKSENLPHFSRDAVAALIEHSARIAGRSDELTARFGRLADIVREAAWLTSKEGESLVSSNQVRVAIDRGRHRANLPARRFRKMITEGIIGVAVEGETIGQINGLAVIESGPLTYGFPNRITATIGAGTAGAVNIEREADLSGAIHTKGFYILGGLLRYLLRTDHPLAFSASIAFEQSYGGIDGDSASAAEMCALLSALTDVPLRQDLAITGAIDQLGNIQPVGAVTEKVEGFYLVCKEQGLTGTQGVAVPRANVRNLMLHPEVVEQCQLGKFHIYPLDTIQDALELFTGLVAGQPDESGSYTEGSLLGLAEERAFAYWNMAMGNNEFEVTVEKH